MSSIKEDVKETVKAFIQTLVSIIVKEVTKRIIKNLTERQKRELESKVKAMSDDQLAQYLDKNPYFKKAFEKALKSFDYIQSTNGTESLMEKLQSISESNSFKKSISSSVWLTPKTIPVIIVCIALLATVAVPAVFQNSPSNNSTSVNNVNNHSFNYSASLAKSPVANFSSNISKGFSPLTVQFNDSSTNATALKWDFGDGNNSAEKNPEHTYFTEGNYTVNLTAINGKYLNSTTSTITVLKRISRGPMGQSGSSGPSEPSTPPPEPPVPNPTFPVANFSANVTSGYVPLTVQFTDLSENATALDWEFGDGNNSTEKNPMHIYQVKGNYLVNLVVRNGNGTDSKTTPINVTDIPIQPVLPVANFSANVTKGGAPLTVQFIDSSKNATSWSWNFGDGQTSSAQNPITKYSAGTYTVSLTASNANGSNITTKSNLITVDKTTPTIIWSDISNITYGTKLNETQLNAAASNDGQPVFGSFDYIPGNGTVLSAGTQTLHAVFTPIDTVNYTNATRDIQINVLQATPTIDWSNPEDITYGESIEEWILDDEGKEVPGVLNAVFRGIDGNQLPGNHTYTPEAGTVLSAGTGQKLHVDFIPTDKTNYTNATRDVQINVLQAPLYIDWSNPADIIYGTALGSTQLNAVAKNPINGNDLSATGTFTYNPTSGSILKVGDQQTLSVAFTTADPNYTSGPVTKDVQINVLQATPTIDWSNPADITYGELLNNTQLNAVFKGIDGNPLSGNHTYTPDFETKLNAGAGQNLHVDFTPSDTANYTSATANVTINVLKATPKITWNKPEDITYGTALSGTQLNANASILGFFFYNPGNETVLSAGTQTLNALFTPIDSANYTNATASVKINVHPQPIAPVADFSANVTSGYAPLSVQFNDNSKNATEWHWDFGEGTNSTLKNPTHTYLEAGNYTVNLTAINADGTASKNTTITVLPVYVYVTNSGNNTVSLIDTATKKVSMLPVGKQPLGVVVNPDGIVYLTFSGKDKNSNGSISVFDTATKNVPDPVEVGNYPISAADSPDGKKVYVANLNDSTVSVIDTALNAVIATVPVGNFPFGVAVSPDGRKVYVAGRNMYKGSKAYMLETASSGFVFIIDTATNNVSKIVSGLSNPYGVAVTPDGKEVYVANAGNSTVSVINTSTQEVTTSVSVRSYPVGVSITPDGKEVYVANYADSTVSVIDTATNTVTSNVSVGINPFEVAVTPDGKEVYVLCTDIGKDNVISTVSVIDTSTHSVISDPVIVGRNALGIATIPRN